MLLDPLFTIRNCLRTPQNYLQNCTKIDLKSLRSRSTTSRSQKRPLQHDKEPKMCQLSRNMPPTWAQHGLTLELRACKKSAAIDLAVKIFLTCPPGGPRKPERTPGHLQNYLKSFHMIPKRAQKGLRKASEMFQKHFLDEAKHIN